MTHPKGHKWLDPDEPVVVRCVKAGVEYSKQWDHFPTEEEINFFMKDAEYAIKHYKLT